MATRVEFISVNYFYNNTPINHNIDADILRPIILNSADRYLLPILGTNLFNKLQNDITGNTVTGQYKILLDTYIQPCLKEFVLYESLPHVAFRFTNKNVTKKTGENSDPVDLSELKLLSERIFSNATFFAQRITNYLLANQDLFSEYFSQTGNIDDYIPQSTQYFSGIHIPNDGIEQFGDYSVAMRYYNLLNNI